MNFWNYCQTVFTDFKWQWIIEIVIVAALFYWAWSFFKKRNAVWLAYIAFLSFVAVFIGTFLDFKGTQVYILMLVLCCVVVPCALFAVDMRRGLFRMARRDFLSTNKNMSENLSHEDIKSTIEDIVRACQNMSKNDIGALIVITNKPLDAVVESGTALSSLLTSELIETIFFPKSPLHDGAIVVTANRIVAAGCYLPLTSRNDIPKEFGTRHRAAIGISESNPTVTAIVVSEESGIISAMHDGKVLRYLDGETLSKIVMFAMSNDDKIEEADLWGE